MALIADIAFYVFTASFLSGLLITLISGSARAIKVYLGLLTIVSIIGLILGLILTRGILTFLLFQIITLVIIIFFVIIAGAAVGGGFYSLIHKKPSPKNLDDTELCDYIPISEFSLLENISEERAYSRIRTGFYIGGLSKGRMFIHRNELSKRP